MRPLQEEAVDLWDEDFEEMAEKIHRYITDFLDDQGLEAEQINGKRREVETGYRYTGQGLEFKFSLAGTVNTDPEILKDGKRKIVFQTEEENSAYTELLEDLEEQTNSQIKEREYNGLNIYDLEIDIPYS